jgi:NAD(P)-dependent dehydrogenase (short-subunit alcohol dehydrogenase family)
MPGYADVNVIEDFSEEDFRAQIETNLWDVINVTRAALPVLRDQGGHVIQISSVGGRDTAPGVGPYQTAKWAVEGISGVLQKEVGPLGIHVTLIEPGGMRTEWGGSSMTVHPIRGAYTAVGRTAAYRVSGPLPLGDPKKAAQAILKISEVPKPAPAADSGLAAGSRALHGYRQAKCPRHHRSGKRCTRCAEALPQRRARAGASCSAQLPRQ